MKVLLDLHFVFMDCLLWSCLEFCCHVHLNDVYASDKVTNAGNGLMPEIKFLVFHGHSTTGSHFPFFFFLFFLPKSVFKYEPTFDSVCQTTPNR